MIVDFLFLYIMNHILCRLPFTYIFVLFSYFLFLLISSFLFFVFSLFFFELPNATAFKSFVKKQKEIEYFLARKNDKLPVLFRKWRFNL